MVDTVELSLLGSVIKTAYEAEPDTNAFTDNYRQIVENTSGVNTGDQDLSGYLLSATANVTYLSISDAEETYLKITDAEGLYLTESDAAATYLTITDADTTYLTIANASATYLTTVDAAATYLSSVDAAATYVPQAALGAANGVAQLGPDQKLLSSQVPDWLLGGVKYQGVWNATTNINPTIVSGVGTKGHYWVVAVAGSTNIDGISDWKLGDWIIFNGTAWEKVDNTDAVLMVNGKTGNVVLDTSDIADTTNRRYLTDAQLANISNAASGSTNGYLTSTDWTTFNNKLTSSLLSGRIFVGNGSNVATAVAVTGDISIDNAGVTAITAGAIINSDINAGAAIAFSKLATLPSANILVGSAGGVATAVAMTGDISISATGVTAIAANAIVNADINASAAIAWSKMQSLPSTNILVGNVSGVATPVSVTGDIAMSATGVTAINAGVIVNADINASAAIALSKLATQAARTVTVNAMNAAAVPTALQLGASQLLGCNSGGTALGAITLNGPTMSGTTLSAIGGAVGTTDRKTPISSGTGGQTLQASAIGIDASNNIGTIQNITQEISNSQSEIRSENLTIRSITGRYEVLHDAITTSTSPQTPDKPNWTFVRGNFAIRYSVVMTSVANPDKEFYIEGVAVGHVTSKGIHVFTNNNIILFDDQIGNGSTVSFVPNGKASCINMVLTSGEAKGTCYWWVKAEATHIQKT